MFRRIGMGAAAVLTAGVLAVGCSDDSSDTIAGGGFLLTDNFPGNSVQDNNVADDQRAFSNSGVDTDVDDARIYWNCTNNTAIMLYVADAGDQMLFAHYWNGSSWGPGVQIAGADQDRDATIDGFKVLWLNTTGNTNAEAAARNGDAIILFRSTEELPGIPLGTSDDREAVDRLYGTYFDVSAAGAGASGTVLHGFQTVATTIDFRHTIDNDGSLEQDFGVEAFGFVSDSLCCTHRFTTSTDDVDSGELTTFVYLVFSKEPTDGDLDAAGDEEGDRYFAVEFDLEQTGNAIPAAGTAPAALVPLPTGIDTTTNVETANDQFLAHDELMLYRMSGVEDTGTTTGNPDSPLLAVAMNAAGLTAFEVSSAREDDSSDDTELPDAGNVYGPDHGLASWYILYPESGFNLDSADGERAQNVDLMLARFDIDFTTGAVTEAAGSPIEIDALTGTLDSTDNDDAGAGDGVPVLGGDSGDVDQVESRINRSGEYILALYTQENDETDDLDDADGNEAADADDGQRDVNNVLRGVVIQTRRDDGDLRTLATTASPSFEAGGATSDVDTDAVPTVNVDVNQDVTNFRFQQGLAQGQAKSQADGEECDLGCTFQANNRRMSWTYEQDEAINFNDASDQDLGQLFLNGVIVALSTDAAVAPAAQTATGEILLDELDEGNESGTGYSDGFGQHVAFDAGDTTRTTTAPITPTAASGRVIVLWTGVPDADQNDDSAATGALENRRLFVSEQNAAGTGLTVDKALVSSSDQFGIDRQIDELVAGEMFPYNEDIVAAPHHVGSGVHLYWTEDSNFPGSSDRLMTRFYDVSDTMSADPVQQVLANRFQPPLTSSALTGVNEEPVAIDNPFQAVIDDFNNTPESAVSGSTVGIYFEEADRLYFQQISSEDPETGYFTENGAPAPQLVDNDSFADDEVQDWRIFFPPVCNDLARSMAVFEKTDSSSDRIFVRVHN